MHNQHLVMIGIVIILLFWLLRGNNNCNNEHFSRCVTCKNRSAINCKKCSNCKWTAYGCRNK